MSDRIGMAGQLIQVIGDCSQLPDELQMVGRETLADESLHQCLAYHSAGRTTTLAAQRLKPDFLLGIQPDAN